MSFSRWLSRTAVSTACVLGSAAPLAAVNAGSVSIHGAVSATAAVSDRYNFLGETKGSPDINVIEAVINGSRRFENGLAAAAQLYAYEVDNYSDVALDFANLDYSFAEQFGLRAGRVKWAAGLYGDVQDIDVLRPFAFLPLNFYQKTLRPITAAFDGVSAYGTLSLNRAGSLDYQVGYGYLPPVDENSAYLRSAMQNALNTVDSFDGDTVSAAWLFWNLPVDGLRVGYSHNKSYDFAIRGRMKSAAEVALAAGTARLTPLAFPAGMWDQVVAGRPATLNGDSTRETWSVEYTRGDWQFASEYLLTTNSTAISYAAPIGLQNSRSKNESYYAMATWQATDRWGFGAYYAEAFADHKDRHGRAVMGVPRHTAWLKDLALAASFNLTDAWLLKAEIHQLDGTLGMTVYNNRNAATWQQDWTYFVVKSTISF